MQFLGEAAGLLTSVCWSVSSVAFTLASRRVGAASVNHVRIWLALILLALIHTILFGIPFPFHAGEHRFVWLGISGLCGFVLADGLLFESFVVLGPRLSMLLLTLAPAFGTLLGWSFLGERPTLFNLAGIAVTLLGIAIVVSATGGGTEGGRKADWRGLLLGAGAAVAQACGFLFSKIGMQGEFSPFSANLIRLTAATAGIAVMALIRKQLVSDVQKMKDRRAFLATLSGTVCGPVLGVVLSLYAVSHVFIGIAITLTSLPPIFLLPIGHFIFGERITLRVITGTILSLFGVILLFTK